MVVLGFILVALGVLAAISVGIAASGSASIEGFGVELETTAAVAYFAGAATAVVLFVGLWLMLKGSARSYRRRQEVKALRRQVGTAPAAGAGPAATDDARPAAGPDVPPRAEHQDTASAEGGEKSATAR
jgi:hypothetical protein